MTPTGMTADPSLGGFSFSEGKMRNWQDDIRNMMEVLRWGSWPRILKVVIPRDQDLTPWRKQVRDTVFQLATRSTRLQRGA